MKNGLKWFLMLFVLFFALTGCQKIEQVDSANAANTFKVLAGSELKDVMEPIQKFADENGIKLQITYSGSLDAVDTLSGSHQFDAVWLSHSKYLQLVPQVKTQIVSSEKTMYSQVVLGMREEKISALGWDKKPASWKDIYAEVKKGNLTLAMTNPSGSNTGFVTLVGVASAFSGKADALEVADIPKKMLKEFFSGVTLTSGSSGDLATKFAAKANAADALISYEASIKQLPVKLVIVKPTEGVVTADYPFMLLNRSTLKPQYAKILAYLRSPEFQTNVVLKTGRTPLAGAADNDVVNELPFPGSLAVVDAILEGYLNEFSKPSSSYFVLDTSGSMAGDRLDALKESITGLTSSEGSVGGRFSTFKQRERVTLVRFSHETYPAKSFELTTNKEDNLRMLKAVREEISGYTAEGGTSIYSAIANIYAAAQLEMKKGTHRVTIVVMTDGQNGGGLSVEEFTQFVQSKGNPRVPVYGILYGEADVKDMQTVAQLTEGQVFDARKTPLNKVFKQIRAYQ